MPEIITVQNKQKKNIFSETEQDGLQVNYDTF